MERITSISQLKKGDKIWTINKFTGSLDIIKFVCEHPDYSEYSIFLDDEGDGMSKFDNKCLTDEKYYRYDGSSECWHSIYAALISWNKLRIDFIEERMSHE